MDIKRDTTAVITVGLSEIVEALRLAYPESLTITAIPQNLAGTSMFSDGNALKITVVRKQR